MMDLNEFLKKKSAGVFDFSLRILLTKVISIDDGDRTCKLCYSVTECMYALHIGKVFILPLNKDDS